MNCERVFQHKRPPAPVNGSNYIQKTKLIVVVGKGQRKLNEYLIDNNGHGVLLGPRPPMVTLRIFNTRLLISLLTSGLIIYLLIYLHLMAYGHTPLYTANRTFTQSRFATIFRKILRVV